MRLYPAIDLMSGRCVRLTKGEYGTAEIVDRDPVVRAKRFEDMGFRYLHLVDLDAAKDPNVSNIRVLEEIASTTNLNIDFSGGIRDMDKAKIAFDSGAQAIGVGSIAVEEPQVALDLLYKYGGDKIILAMDSRNGYLATRGWQSASAISIFDQLKLFSNVGLKRLMSTDIERDGTGLGIRFDYYQQLTKQLIDVEVIASGGVRGVEDIQKAEEAGAQGIVIGKALYNGSLTEKDLQPWLV